MADKPVYPAFGGSSFKPPPLSKKSKEKLLAESSLVKKVRSWDYRSTPFGGSADSNKDFPNG
jgi:hypothetical protein|tara:strand:+ start:527 stop:712 length:186 start_codon:yes stop_codon:yes gene_type:complete